jgi:HAD superfamily hydrolase (TIGR01484 family)
MSIKLIAFDLDGTLAPSKGFISLEIAHGLEELLERIPVCIITGGNKKQIVRQVVKKLSKQANLKNLHVMPTSGAAYLKHRFIGWKPIYELKLTKKEVRKIKKITRAAANLLGYWPKDPYGKVIENRGSQITFSALGQKAPGYLKDAWDKDGEKKKKLKSTIAHYLPEFEVRSGGSTSIDITRKGIDKGFAVNKLIEINNLKTSEVVFVGDRFDKNGNDYPVLKTKVRCIEVKIPWQTVGVIRNLLKTL